MRKYAQLTQGQRYHIYAFLKAGFLQTQIASEIGVHKSTISREIRRNRGQKGYRPKQANLMAGNRRQNAKKHIKMMPEIIALICPAPRKLDHQIC